MFGRENEPDRIGVEPRGWIIVARRVPGPAYTQYQLRSGVAYTFIVRGENAHGLSPPSQPSEPITLKEPVDWSDPGQRRLAEAQERLGNAALVSLVDAHAVSSNTVKLEWEVSSHNQL